MEQLQYEKEVREAIQAADTALNYLERAERCLNSAGNWGMLDLFGGGFISTLAKHSKMDDAEREMSNARAALRKLSKELQDVGRIEELHIETGDFLTFADYFFDGLIADWMVQSKISDAKNQVREAKYKVNDIRNHLRNQIGY